jgi:hypothetical protein
MDSLDKIITDGESYGFTNEDLLNLTDNKYKIYKYHDLRIYNNVNEILGHYGGAIILFQNKSENSGHWVCIFKKDSSTLYFFDSYGLKPDDELQYSQYNLRIHRGKQVPHLTHLLNTSNYTIEYNKTKFQEMLSHTNTCGRHIATRLNMRKLNEEEYKKFLMDNKYYNPDFWVTVLTHQYGTTMIF